MILVGVKISRLSQSIQPAFTMLSSWFLIVPIIALAGQPVGQSQSLLGLDSFTQNHLPPSLAYSWNGLTTFAKSTPLRCLGVDGNQTYDVAVLGMLSIKCLNDRAFIDVAVY